MNRAKEILEFGKILEQLGHYAVSETAKTKLLELDMLLNEKQLEIKMNETTEARRLLDGLGMPPLSSMKGLERMVKEVEIGTMLEPETLMEIVSFIKATRQMKRYLARGEYLNCELALYGRGFYAMEELEEEIERSIRNNQVDSEASPALRGLRRNIELKKENMKSRLEKIVHAKKNYLADSYILNRGGHYVIAVKREYKHQVEGQCFDTSRSGGTLFIEPAALGKLQEELALLEIEESNEVRRILYTLTNEVESYLGEIKGNMEMMLALDIAFAKGKLSQSMQGNAVKMVTDRKIVIKQGRHPLLPSNKCIPLDFEIGGDAKGIVITGPNTGGKTVALKTIGLLSMMAQCGLHVPVAVGSQFAMHNQILCDIGDGQSIEESLSTFSAHIKSITEILEIITGESLVLLDELGSGTDPKEGMGIAIAILEALRQKAGLFVATTHYPEVKDYALSTPNLQNACMQFDKETLRPLYTLKIGEAGDSCALYIAEKLGFPKVLIELAQSYITKDNDQEESPKNVESRENKQAERRVSNQGENGPSDIKIGQNESKVPQLIKQKVKKEIKKVDKFNVGDSVLIFPNKEKGIVFAKANELGEIGVQMQGRKKWIKAKRLKLLVAASELYPADYDFSILFDSVANRKAKKKMSKGYKPEIAATYQNEEEARWGSSK